MLAHSYRLRLTERIRQLAFLTVLGALLNAFGPRLVAHERGTDAVQHATQRATELPVTSPIVESGNGQLDASGVVSASTPECDPAHVVVAPRA